MRAAPSDLKSPAPPAARDVWLDLGAPLLFAFLWSTGWIVAKAAAPQADPLTFLSVRFACAGVLVAGIAALAGARWPRGRAAWRSLIAGALLHGVYLGGVWWAIAHGLPAGVSALLAALHPLAAAALAGPLLGERVGARAWAGVALGTLGIALVLGPKLAAVEPGALGAVLVPLLVNVAAMAGVSAGTFYQKRLGAEGDLRAMTALQYAGALLLVAPLALVLEAGRFDLNLASMAALAWSVVGLSMGAIGLMLAMIRRGAVAKVAALNFLVPPTAAVMAFAMFGERMEGVQVVGLIVAALGTALVTRRG